MQSVVYIASICVSDWHSLPHDTDFMINLYTVHNENKDLGAYCVIRIGSKPATFKQPLHVIKRFLISYMYKELPVRFSFSA